MSLLFPKVTETRRVREDQVSTPYVDEDEALFRTLGHAPRDLLANTLRKAQDLCVTLYRANPLANRMIRIYRSYLAGSGFAVGATNPEVKAVVEEAWSAPRSQLDRYVRDYARDWCIFGELFLPVGVDEAGNTTVGFIDPTRVNAVRRDPDHNMLLTEIEVRSAREVGGVETLKIVGPDLDPFSEMAGLLGGEVCAWPLERVAASTRGMPLLMPILDWLDGFDQVLWEMLERQKAIRAYFWDVAVEGGKQAVDEAAELFGTDPPKTGSVRIHSNTAQVKAESPTLGAYEDVAAARFHLRHLATGSGLAPHWVGDPEDANRSTAEQMDLPVLRNLVDVQADWRANLQQLLGFVVDAKVGAGLLDRVLVKHDERGNEIEGELLPARQHVEVTVPEIDTPQVEAAAGALLQVAQAMGQLEMIDGVSRDVIRRVVRTMLPALGVPADELPEEDDGEMFDQAVESLYRQAARGGLERLLAKL